MRGRKAEPRARAKKTDPAKRADRRTATAVTARKPSKAVRASEERAQLAQERAKAFVAPHVTAEPPGFMVKDPQYAGVVAVWRYYAPLLEARRFWQAEFYAMFVGFCVYCDEFLAADRDVKKKGWGVESKTTSGADRFWDNPAVDVRDHAFMRVQELSARFGFTTLDLYKLERESAAARAGGSTPRSPGDAPAAAPADGEQAQMPLPPPPGEGAGSGFAFDTQTPPRDKQN